MCPISAEKIVKYASNGMRILTAVVYAIIIGLLYFAIYLNTDPTINWIDMIRVLDNACITIVSIILAAIFAIMGLMISKDKPIKTGIGLMAVTSIAALITSLFSIYLSYNSKTFDSSKFLLFVTMGITIANLAALFIILNFKSNDYFGEFPLKES